MKNYKNKELFNGLLDFYKDLGFEKVVGVDATTPWLAGGALHCLTNEFFVPPDNPSAKKHEPGLPSLPR